MNSIPAASSAAMTFVRLSITPRTTPLLASIRWIVGSETPETLANVFCSIPAKALAALICAAVSKSALRQSGLVADTSSFSVG